MRSISSFNLTQADDSESLFRDAELKEQRGDLSGSFASYFAAAELGNVLCQLAVGNLYSQGRGVQRNLDEAARWYKRAYRNGLSAGAINLAVDLQKQDKLTNAIAWLKRAIAMSDGEAYLQLAHIYLRRSRGVKLATALLRKALTLDCSHLSDKSRLEVSSILKGLARTPRRLPKS